MPTPKEHVENLLNELPDAVSWEQWVNDVWFMAQIEESNREFERGEAIPRAVVMKEIDAWLSKSNGRRGQKATTQKYSPTSKKTPALALSASPAK